VLLEKWWSCYLSVLMGFVNDNAIKIQGLPSFFRGRVFIGRF
jgi:hypothetical protein